ncbi:hypothetical protein EGI11_03185 [Chryseobacterium sp. H3056]|uniref:Uncharacterized protein n=2 Tax=Kaistella daneshvariae TaxID=2487074 RepID=A0A3N0WXU9_9FLAO|nr:hypothetical protein EGI11_03185 [Kaistella daneshvariae]
MVNQPSEKQSFVSAIFVLVKRFCNLVNVKGNLNEDQMIELSVDLYERFKCESLEDVALFFKRARSGEFAEFYRLDTTVIMKWVESYLDEKSEVFEREVINQNNIRRRQENDAVSNHVPDEKAKEYLNQLSAKLNKVGKKNSGTITADNPLFSLSAYVENLRNTVGEMPDGLLKKMAENTSKISHPEVWEILTREFELRNQKPKK